MSGCLWGMGCVFKVEFGRRGLGPEKNRRFMCLWLGSGGWGLSLAK